MSVIHRENPSSSKFIVLIARSAYKHGVSNDVNVVIDLPGVITSVRLISYIKVISCIRMTIVLFHYLPRMN